MSVIVASYRRPEELVECLDGLEAQTRAPAEVIVVAHISDRPNAAYVDERAVEWEQLRGVIAEDAGTVAAYNSGLGAAGHELVAFIDDDAVPEPDWIERLVGVFAQDRRIAAVGGRDVIQGRVVEPGSVDVGRLQWFGRMVGNHHRGVGGPRDVDILKGVNMAFRRAEVIDHGFDRRLRGRRTQMNSELSICLPLRRRGLRIVYDPSIVVRHRGAARPGGDHRDPGGDKGVRFDPELIADAVHNETLQILDYFRPAQRAVFAIWASLVGTSDAPGLVVFARDLGRRRRPAWQRLVAGQRGRVEGWRTHRATRRAQRVLARLEHRPPQSWRSRHVFGALRLRTAAAQHSEAEAQALMRHATSARTVVELGVAEGGSAAELRSVMSPGGELHLVDPYEPGKLGVSMALAVARRTITGNGGARVTWIRKRSDEAVLGWDREIDFLFIDADHTYERASSDWRLWTRFVRPGGKVALHDSAVFPGGWTDEFSGPVRLLAEIIDADNEWSLVESVDSLSIVERSSRTEAT